MRRMYSESELRAFIKNHGDDVVTALAGKDLSIEGLTSKGIANTGAFANIGDVTISGDLIVQGENKGNISATDAITGKTLKQSQANFVSDFSFPTPQEGLDVENIYNRFEEINGVLYCIVNLKLTNNTENSITAYQVSSGWRYISEIADKIVDLEGKKVSEARTGSCLICAHDFATSNNPTQTQNSNLNGILVLDNSADPNACTLICRWNSGLTIPAGESRWVSGRLFLTLL